MSRPRQDTGAASNVSLHTTGSQEAHPTSVHADARPGQDHRRTGLRTPRIVIFDLGEVLATPPGLYAALAAAIERRPEAVGAAYWAYRDAYDRGGSAQAFWSDVLAELGVSPAEDAVSELTRIDTEAWTTIRPDAVSLLCSLSTQGVRLGILSNATREMAQAARRTPWAAYVSDWFFSAELRLAKPDQAIYSEVTNVLGYPPQSIVFVDDRPVNVEAAREAGWNAHTWTSGENTRTLMSDLGLLPAR
ncbi:HAD family phosphatase [Streptomyces sp. NPDC097640]|uniref:HAD family hydrolase n=1 Tax=Streptomyces sp. NPDC097640 TaxID=3157229 RepID=UPI0033273E1F